MTEMQNPEFARLTAPGVNVDALTAYRVVHQNEIAGAEMQFAAQKSAERIANAVRENGVPGYLDALVESTTGYIQIELIVRLRCIVPLNHCLSSLRKNRSAHLNR